MFTKSTNKCAAQLYIHVEILYTGQQLYCRNNYMWNAFIFIDNIWIVAHNNWTIIGWTHVCIWWVLSTWAEVLVLVITLTTNPCFDQQLSIVQFTCSQSTPGLSTIYLCNSEHELGALSQCCSDISSIFGHAILHLSGAKWIENTNVEFSWAELLRFPTHIKSYRNRIRLTDI